MTGNDLLSIGQLTQGRIPPASPHASCALLTSTWLGKGRPGTARGRSPTGQPELLCNAKGPLPCLPAVYYEGLQDKLAQIRDARGALSALREEHREKLRRAAEEAERQRQIQLAQKLEIMRQKKQVRWVARRRGTGRGDPA